MQPIAAYLRRLLLGKAAEPHQSRSAADYRLLAEHSSDIVMEIGTDRLTSYISPSCKRLLGWEPEELIGRGPEAFVAPEFLSKVQANLADFDAGVHDESTLVLQLRKKAGGVLWVEGKARMVRTDETGSMGKLVAVVRDISERKKREDELARAAMTDALTEIGNRRAFNERLDREWARTVQHGGQMALLLIDIDRFKDFNDTYGHQAGDDCLRVVARAAQGALQHADSMLARYGGEEFAAILPDTDLPGAMNTAERIRQAVWETDIPHLKNQDCGDRVTVSIGAAAALSRVGGTIRMPEGLLLAADGALYKAKHNGRNRVEAALLLAPDRSTSAA